MITKIFLIVSALTILGVVGSSRSGGQPGHQASDPSDQNATEFSWQFKDLNAQRAGSDKAYLQFQDNQTMHCGIYYPAAGSRDGQSPHSEDEVYYVESGAGKFHMDGQEFDVKAGTILFVPAMKKHFFHDISEDLSLLVFFSKAKPGD